jgi:predicted Rossmann fold flavoprotein
VAAPDLDVAIVGAGAAGLATAIFLGRERPDLRVAIFDGAARPGAKILVSGGSRCNVTNTVVTAADFNGGRSTIVAQVLKALPVDRTVAFFESLGVRLHEEPGGKLFPDSNRSRDVLDALLREVARVGADLRAGTRVQDVARTEAGFVLGTPRGEARARRVVIATGGRSLPKTGSDGWGYDVARRLGHAIVPTTPALVPLVLDEGDAGARDDGGVGVTLPHRGLSGVSQTVRLDVRVDGRIAHRIHGAMLWTHFGISGPAALDASRHWLRARLESRPVSMTASLAPGSTFESLDAAWIDAARRRPRAQVVTLLGDSMPAAIAEAMTSAVGLPAGLTLAGLSREDRRRLLHALVELPLPVRDSRGYNYAEVTAGGVELSEISPKTMESRVCPGLSLVGEILDVDGRIGGFNFQWAWASAKAASAAIAQRADVRPQAPGLRP